MASPKTTAVYPPRAARAIGFLKSNKNDIAIFVEDSAAPNLWTKFIRKFLPNGCEINDVTVLGGKENVIAACKVDQNRDGKRLYIIDGDIDYLTGNAKPRLKHLYRLRAYCIENYLLQQDALVDLAMSYDVSVSQSDAHTRIDLLRWYNENNDALTSVFLSYAVVMRLGCSIKTVTFHVSRLLDEQSSRKNLCAKKTSSRVFGVYRELLKTKDAQSIREAYKASELIASRLHVSVFVSGKDYLLPPIFSLMKEVFGFNIKFDAFKALLAERISPKIDPYLSKRLKGIYQS